MKPFDLKAFQTDFVETMTSGELNLERYEDLIPSKNLNLLEALETYRRDYTSRLSDALAEAFSSVHYVLGDSDFFQLCYEYLDKYTSRSYDLGEYGQEFPHFIGKHSLTSDFPFLKELAQLEIELTALFHLAVSPLPDLSILEQLQDPSPLKIKLIAAHKLISSRFALFDLWNWQNTPEKEIDMNVSQYLIIFKNERGVRNKILSQAQYEILQSFNQDKTFNEALDSLDLNSEIDITADITNLFTLLRHENLIQELVLSRL